VLGGGDEVESLVKKHNVKTILIAIPSATGVEMTRILKLCHAAGVTCKTVPGLAEIIEEEGLAGQIREVAVEDLLGRTLCALKKVRSEARSKAKSSSSPARRDRSAPNSAGKSLAFIPPGLSDLKSPSPRCSKSIAKCARRFRWFPSIRRLEAFRIALVSTTSCANTDHPRSLSCCGL
jgi:hypothetical protein